MLILSGSVLLGLLIGVSLVIVGITALIGAFGHARSGNVRWATGILFGITGVAASLVGTALNRQVDPNVLLLAFAALMLLAAAGMLRRATGPTRPTATARRGFDEGSMKTGHRGWEI